jgi:hypothetical protein
MDVCVYVGRVAGIDGCVCVRARVCACMYLCDKYTIICIMKQHSVLMDRWMNVCVCKYWCVCVCVRACVW